VSAAAPAAVVKRGTLGYLASPYAHPDPKVRERRYLAAMDVVVDSMVGGGDIVLYSPIVHNHPSSLRYDLPRDWEFWKKIDFPMLERCDTLFVLTIPGWEHSVGVTAEIEFAQQLGKQVELIENGRRFNPARFLTEVVAK